MSVDYDGKLYNFHRYALVFIGDTPTSALAGGFKEGVDGAHRSRVYDNLRPARPKGMCVLDIHVHVCMSVMGNILLYAA